MARKTCTTEQIIGMLRKNERVRKAMSNLTLDKLILKEALEGKY